MARAKSGRNTSPSWTSSRSAPEERKGLAPLRGRPGTSIPDVQTSIERVDDLRRGDDETARARWPEYRPIRSLSDLNAIRTGISLPRETDVSASSRASGPRILTRFNASPDGDARRLEGDAADARINGARAGGRYSLSDARGRYRGRGFGLGSTLRGALQAGFTRGFPSGTRSGAAHALSTIVAPTTVTATDGNLVTPTFAQRSGRSTRSAGLGSGSTRTTSTGRPSCSVKRLG